MFYLPEAQLATDNTGINVVESIITDGAPDSLVSDLQTTFTLCRAVNKSHIYNSHCTLVSMLRAFYNVAQFTACSAMFVTSRSFHRRLYSAI